MDLALSPEHELVRQTVREFAERRVAPVAAELDRDRRFPYELVAEMAGPEVAQTIQLQIEYAPAPPFNSGRPEDAPPAILSRIKEQSAGATARARRAVEDAVARNAAVATNR